MYDRKALGRRILRARIERLQRDMGKNVSLRALGARVARSLGKPRFSGNQVLDYVEGRVEKVGIDVVAAFADACGTDAAWLAFGDEHIPEVPKAAVSERFSPDETGRKAGAAGRSGGRRGASVRGKGAA